MKKALIGALASLMLAGALCAVDGAGPINPTTRVVLAADGQPPISVSLSSTSVADASEDSASFSIQF